MIEPSREDAHPSVRMKLGDGAPDLPALNAELLSGHEQRPQSILRQRGRFYETARNAQPRRRPRAHAREDRNAEHDAVCPRIASTTIGRGIEDSIAGHDAPQSAESVGEERA